MTRPLSVFQTIGIPKKTFCEKYENNGCPELDAVGLFSWKRRKKFLYIFHQCQIIELLSERDHAVFPLSKFLLFPKIIKLST